MTHLAILCVRNEAAFLLEWLAHHRAVGFNDFLVFSNDCDDGTDLVLDRLAEMGQLTHIRNDGPYDKGGIQFTALKAAAKLDQVKNADWILPLDIDEFVNIHVGDHTLSALHAAVPDATAITLTWRLFGSAGQVRYSDAPMTETFTQCAPAVMYWPWRASMFKTLYRNDGTYAKPGVHRPRSPDQSRLANANWVDGNGTLLPDMFKTKRIFSNFGRDNYGLVQLNHYALGALESYVLKADRGRAVHSDHLLGMDYWVERNFNTDRDQTIHALKPERDAYLADLMTDATLAKLHKTTVAWRKARFTELMQLEPFRALFGRLLMTPGSAPVPQKAAQFMVQHANMARQPAPKKTT
ncbi:glycosyl transferase family 2 [Sulfitobacter sp. SK012]|uniref:glycosyltransferase family 2 protein n=1 Tax=Sulfitobacter sp. SK012 TaxID=1389005 RepID=UPI000E0BAA04|nr:glycosyltransferase family 2 protein [Sulfitobacter sp. SK012]AXI46133.1 glycosyl transferase family 2 [Sulfitobacter sp. SK012]